MVLHPVQCRNLIHKPEIGTLRRSTPGPQRRMGKKAKTPHPVIETDNHNTMPRQSRAIV